MPSDTSLPRVLLITGASRGIGAACALRAADAGRDVGVNFHRDEAAAEQVVAQGHARGRRACALQADVASEGASTADEVAQPVAILLSDAAGYVTGATLDVAGGR